MQKHSTGRILYIIPILLLLCSGILAAKFIWSYYQKVISLNNNRHVLFCEKLKTGMSISEVSDILNKTGNVIIRMGDYNSQYYADYSILFTDKNVQSLYGGWTELVFVEGKYSKAYTESFDSTDVICDFSQATSKP